MLFETFAAGGCKSYVVGCEANRAAALIDPEISLVDCYIGHAAQHGLHIRYIIDTHTHADHFSASRATRQNPLRARRHAPAQPDAARRPEARRRRHADPGRPPVEGPAYAGAHERS